MIDTEWLKQALTVITNGTAEKLCKDNVTVYRCGCIIRVDIKV